MTRKIVHLKKKRKKKQLTKCRNMTVSWCTGTLIGKDKESNSKWVFLERLYLVADQSEVLRSFEPTLTRWFFSWRCRQAIENERDQEILWTSLYSISLFAFLCYSCDMSVVSCHFNPWILRNPCFIINTENTETCPGWAHHRYLHNWWIAIPQYWPSNFRALSSYATRPSPLLRTCFSVLGLNAPLSLSALA